MHSGHNTTCTMHRRRFSSFTTEKNKNKVAESIVSYLDIYYLLWDCWHTKPNRSLPEDFMRWVDVKPKRPAELLRLRPPTKRRSYYAGWSCSRHTHRRCDHVGDVLKMREPSTGLCSLWPPELHQHSGRQLRTPRARGGPCRGASVCLCQMSWNGI